MLSIKFPHNLSKTLDRAIARLENGESIEHIVASSPSWTRVHLAEFLPIAAELRGIPVIQTSSSNRRYSFLNHTVEKASRFARVMRGLRTGYAISGAFVLLLIVGVSSAAAQSLPGSKLFTIKKAWETAQIKVVPHTPGDRAQLELALANQRLDDAQEVFSDKSSNASDKAAAIQELNTQTQVALNQIQQVASTPAVTGNPGIIQNLVALTQNQASLQAQVDSSTASSDTAKNQKALAAIQQSVASATNTQTSTTITAKQQVNTTGKITAITSGSFTVEKNVFDISSATQFFSANGLALQQSAFHVGDTVLIVATTSGEKNEAQAITLKEKAVVQTPVDTSGSDSSQSTIDSTGSNIPTTVLPTAPNVSGGLILESPTPQ